MLLQVVSRCCIMGGTGTATRKPRNPYIFTLMYVTTAKEIVGRLKSRRGVRIRGGAPDGYLYVLPDDQPTARWLLSISEHEKLDDLIEEAKREEAGV